MIEHINSRDRYMTDTVIQSQLTGLELYCTVYIGEHISSSCADVHHKPVAPNFIQSPIPFPKEYVFIVYERTYFRHFPNQLLCKIVRLIVLQIHIDSLSIRPLDFYNNHHTFEAILLRETSKEKLTMMSYYRTTGQDPQMRIVQNKNDENSNKNYETYINGDFLI